MVDINEAMRSTGLTRKNSESKKILADSLRKNQGAEAIDAKRVNAAHRRRIGLADIITVRAIGLLPSYLSPKVDSGQESERNGAAGKPSQFDRLPLG